MSLKNALHRPQADARRLRQHPAGPMGCFSRRRRQRQVNHPLHDGRGQRRLARFARLVAGQAAHALRHEPCLPAPYHRFGLAGSPHDLGGAAGIGRRQNDLSAPNMLLRRVAVANNRLKLTTIVRRDVHDNSCSHDKSLNCFGIWMPNNQTLGSPAPPMMSGPFSNQGWSLFGVKGPVPGGAGRVSEDASVGGLFTGLSIAADDGL